MPRSTNFSGAVSVLLAVLLAFLANHTASATLSPDAPFLSVHESTYGTAICGTRSESIQGISIRIASYAESKPHYEVQCFFLKRPKQGEILQVDDTVIFETTHAHATYEVMAKPIKLPGGGKAPKTKSAKSSKKSHTQATSSPDSPREGFIVRVLCEGLFLRQYCSGHQIEQFAKDHQETLDRSAAKKSARHLAEDQVLKR